MGEAAVRFKVMPESTDIDFGRLREDIKAAIPENVRLHAMEEQPIAFGLKALIVVVIMDDKKGDGPEKTETAISKVAGVESVVVEEVGLL